MKVIITMAGASSRFKNKGYKRPKYELIVKGKSMFEWSMKSLENWFKSYTFIFILKDGIEFVEEKCSELGIEQYKIIKIDKNTDGQATTLLYSFSEINEDFIVYNIDTFINGLGNYEIPNGVDGWVPVFDSVGDHWSFVEMDESMQVLNIVEKERISNWATVGLYYFKSKELFQKYYNITYLEKQFKETYIAPIYKTMINDGLIVKTDIVESENVVPLGTPNEVLEFDTLFDKVNLNE